MNWIDGHSGNLIISKEDILIDNKADLLFKILDNKMAPHDKLLEIQKFVTNSDSRQFIRDMFESVNKRFIGSDYYLRIIEKLAESHYRILSMSNTDGQIQLYDFILYLHNIMSLKPSTLDDTPTLKDKENDDKDNVFDGWN
jgi:hypothetical protein